MTFLNKLGYAELSGVMEEIRRDHWKHWRTIKCAASPRKRLTLLQTHERGTIVPCMQCGYESLEHSFNDDHQFRQRMTSFGRPSRRCSIILT